MKGKSIWVVCLGIHGAVRSEQEVQTPHFFDRFGVATTVSRVMYLWICLFLPLGYPSSCWLIDPVRSYTYSGSVYRNAVYSGDLQDLVIPSIPWTE
jgi:hypothetical protein